MKSAKDAIPEHIKEEEGEALRRLIEASDFNQQSLATAASVGTKSVVWQMCKGHRPINIDSATKLARTLGVRIDDFSPRLAQMVREAAAVIRSLPTEVAYLPDQGVQISIVRSTGSSQEAGATWPFKNLTHDQFDQISTEGKTELETLARGMFMEARRQNKSSSNGHGN